MKRGAYLFTLLIAFLLVACADSTQKQADTKGQFDLIEGITGVNNWKWIKGSDTSYLYFSRVADQKINVYHFWMEKGDSVNCELNMVEPVGDTIAWNWGTVKWHLLTADSSAMKWQEVGSGYEYNFQKIDSSPYGLVFRKPARRYFITNTSTFNFSR